MKKGWLIVISLVAVIAIVGAAYALVPGGQGQQAAGEAQSERQRVTSRDATEAKPATLVDGNSAFAFDLYQVLRDTAGNLFYSPYSISLALAMTYAGARGETAEQMAETLHFVLPQDALHREFSDLVDELDRRGEGARGKDGEGFRLNIINAIWGQKGFDFLSEFLNVLAENYGAGLRSLDFLNAPEESRIIINDWVSEQTEGRIEDLIPRDLINVLTRLVLTNAIYFNAAWQHPFLQFATRNGIFHLLDGGGVLVPMMRKTERFGFVEGDRYQVIELPYDGGELSMVILLPDSGHFEAFEELLSAQKVDSIVKRLESRYIALTLPKFEFESDFNLSDTLMTMGMPAAFSADADFSGMTGNRGLSISFVIHKAFVSVDEVGTEAVAATAVGMAVGSPGPTVEVNIDRPFIFLIRDIETGTILFVGRVLNPGV